MSDFDDDLFYDQRSRVSGKKDEEWYLRYDWDESEPDLSSNKDMNVPPCFPERQKAWSLLLDKVIPQDKYLSIGSILKDQKKNDTLGRCKTHGKKLKFFCMEHNAYICSLCYMIGECNHHQFKFVIDIALEVRRKISRFQKNELPLLIQEKMELIRTLLGEFPVEQKQDAEFKLYELSLEIVSLLPKEFEDLDRKRSYHFFSHKLSEYGNYIKAENPSEIIAREEVLLQEAIDKAALSYEEDAKNILSEISQALEQVLEKIHSAPKIDDCPTLFEQIKILRTRNGENNQEADRIWEEEEVKEKEKEKGLKDDEVGNQSQGLNGIDILLRDKIAPPDFKIIRRSRYLIIQARSYWEPIIDLDDLQMVDSLIFDYGTFSVSDSDLLIIRYIQKKLQLKKFYFGPSRETEGFIQTMSSFFWNPATVEVVVFGISESGILIENWMSGNRFSSSNRLSDKDLRHFFQKIVPRMQNLTTFEFLLWLGEVKDQTIFLLAQEIPHLKNLETLSLHLSSTEIEEDSLLVLAQNLPPLKHLQLDCSELSISDRGIKELAEALKGFDHLESLALDFSRTDVSDFGVQALFDNIPETIDSLSLKFSCWKNRITSQSLNNFRKFKLPRLKRLKKLLMNLESDSLQKKFENLKQYLEKRKQRDEESD